LELTKDAGQMGLDGGLANTETAGDFFIAGTFDSQAGNLPPTNTQVSSGVFDPAANVSRLLRAIISSTSLATIPGPKLILQHRLYRSFKKGGADVVATITLRSGFEHRNPFSRGGRIGDDQDLCERT
jgi:hypothetical protein